IDVYRQKFEPTRDVVSFFLFVSIFPLAMAGPIERATNLLPQIYKRRTFDYALSVDGMRQILWGLFKKVVIADNCATIANEVFNNSDAYSGSALLLGAIFCTFQFYGDFSGYSDMALGIGKLLGFKFLQNFRFPYFSRNIAEFWRRWHISLNTWFRDYLYIPLGGSRGSKWQTVRNTFIIFLVSGFWHGANWTYISWGAYHAILFVPIILLGKSRKYTDTVAEGKLLPSLPELLKMARTFG
ncbi:MBOAT family O-acyltransferase, partial [Candidatus Symbiothrix dinenymphae]|uniref:MBOAT family O-acyltransferase n=1 Tax=Candidatus Symbiothrix dinenymphae TaxID=467085 RepID=UPI000B0A1BAD